MSKFKENYALKNEELIKHTQKDKFMHEILDQERFQFINKGGY